jgi:putative membrane protein
MRIAKQPTDRDTVTLCVDVHSNLFVDNSYFKSTSIKVLIMYTIRSLALNAAAIILGTTVITTSGNAQKPSHLSDPEIAHIAVVANQIDINYAKIATKQSKNAQVLKFAKTMSSDHAAIIDQATALVKKLNVTPKDNPTSKQLLADAAKTEKTLRAQSGPSFDKAYIGNEVAYHKAVINVVETVLIPAANNAELKALLQKVVPILKAHLAHAEMVQKSL